MKHKPHPNGLEALTSNRDSLALVGHIQVLFRALLAISLVLGLTLVYWSVIKVPFISARDDNPRLVEAELRVRRGSIFDRNGEIVAETFGPVDGLERHYPYSDIGPAVGYYSFRHGTAGIEESLDSVLRGDSEAFWDVFLRQSLHRPKIGSDVRLTLDSELQRTGENLLGDSRGALLLLELPASRVLAMVSHPAYDPNSLDEQFDGLVADESAPLLNRVTQASYQPGMVLQPFVLAYAVDQHLIELLEETENISEPVNVNGASIGCREEPPLPGTWADSLIYRCPGPMTQLARKLEESGLDQLFSLFHFTSAPPFALETEGDGSEMVTDSQMATIGQGNLTVTPLQVGMAWAALGMDGRLSIPLLVDAVGDEQRDWSNQAEPETLGKAVSAASASKIRQVLTIDENELEYEALALSGPRGGTNVWYLGMAPAVSPKLAVIIVLEESTDLAGIRAIGRQLLSFASR